MFRIKIETKDKELRRAITGSYSGSDEVALTIAENGLLAFKSGDEGLFWIKCGKLFRIAPNRGISGKPEMIWAQIASMEVL
jgi:hypothetical protein